MAKGNVLKEKEPKKKENIKGDKEKKGNLFNSLKAKVDQRKAKSITGALLLLFSVYLFIALFSYLFSWKADQNLIVSQPFFSFIFSNSEIEVANWLGKFGAWISHVFMYKWFGIVSFTFSLLMFITGIRLLLNIRLLPLRKTFVVSFVGILWFFMFFGLISSNINYLGGTFGYQANVWLTSIFGSFGAFLLMIALLFISIITLFNPDFKSLFEKYFKKEKQKEQEEEEEESNSFVPDSANDFETIDENEEELESDSVIEAVSSVQFDDEYSKEEEDPSIELETTNLQNEAERSEERRVGKECRCRGGRR